MRYRFYNARLLTMAQGLDVTEGELWTEDDTIRLVGTPKEAAPEGGFDEEIDCRGNLLMPGFKNAHTHSGMSLMRSSADDRSLDDWLNKSIFPIEARMTGDDIYTLSKISFMEYLTSGITAAMDMYLTPETIAAAAADSGFRCVQVGAMNDFSQSAQLLEQMYERLNGRDPYNSYMLGFHAEYTTCEDNLKKVAELAHSLKAPVWAHISETASEVEGCRKRHGRSPVRYLADMGLFDYGGGGYHLVHVDDDDMDILKEKGMYAVSCPGSNTKLSSGIAPIAEYVKKGIPVAIGTDGPASNNCLDMFREMFLVTGLQKLKNHDAAAMDAGKVLEMATVTGARAMGLTDCDVLAAGKKADLIMIDMHKPNMQPVNNIPKNLVYSGSKDNVRLTMIGGVIRYRDGEFNIGADPEEIYAEAMKIKARIYGELEA